MEVAGCSFHGGWPTFSNHVSQKQGRGFHGHLHGFARQQHLAKDLVAQRFDEGEALFQISRENTRRTIAIGNEVAVDGDNGSDVFSQMGDLAVGLAMPDNRAIRPLWHVHQDDAFVLMRNRFIASCGSIAFKKHA